MTPDAPNDNARPGRKLRKNPPASGRANGNLLPRQPNQSILDGFRCLQQVVGSPTPVGVTDLSAKLNLEATRIHRLLRTLTHLGLVVRTGARKYGPGPAIPVLAAQILHATHFGDLVLPTLERLRKKVHQTVALGVRWEHSITYIYHGSSSRTGSKAIGGHALWPVTRSGLGIAILALLSDAEIREQFAGHPIPPFPSIRDLLGELKRTREQGFAFVPTVGTHWTLAMTLENHPSVALGITGNLTRGDLAHLLPELRKTVSEVNGNLSLFRVR